MKKYFNIQLGQAAQIHFGLQAKYHPDGELKYLRANDFDGLLNFKHQSKFYIKQEDYSPKQIQKALLCENDIIMAGKGSNKFALPYQTNFGKCIPSSVFYIIRLSTPEILPQYLCTFINSKPTQDHLKRHSKGATVETISIRQLKTLKIPVPPIETQKNIIQLAENLKLNIEITQQLLQKKQQLSKEIIAQVFQPNS